MTREGETLKAVKRFEQSLYGSDVASLTRSDMGFAYMSGIRWSDENPKSPWISIKDDLPCNHKELVYNDVSTVLVFVKTKYSTADTDYMRLYGDFTWRWECHRDIITHWMIIPKLSEE